MSKLKWKFSEVTIEQVILYWMQLHCTPTSWTGSLTDNYEKKKKKNTDKVLENKNCRCLSWGCSQKRGSLSKALNGNFAIVPAVMNKQEEEKGRETTWLISLPPTVPCPLP